MWFERTIYWIAQRNNTMYQSVQFGGKLAGETELVLKRQQASAAATNHEPQER